MKQYIEIQMNTGIAYVGYVEIGEQFDPYEQIFLMPSIIKLKDVHLLVGQKTQMGVQASLKSITTLGSKPKSDILIVRENIVAIYLLEPTSDVVQFVESRRGHADRIAVPDLVTG